jgi:hypothetical protein
LGLFAAAGAAIAASGLRSDPSDALPASRERLQWGVYQILWGGAYYECVLRNEIADFASRPDYVMFYRDLDRPFPAGPIEAVRSIGATPMISMELWRWRTRRRGKFLPAINRGDYDDYLRGWADAAKNEGGRILLRFGFEFNGDWFTWSLAPEGYTDAWRRAHDIFQEAGATNVEWVWSPNIESCPNEPGNAADLYYPGDEYVDWVSVDGYNFGDNHDEYHRWQSFEEVYSGVLDRYRLQYSHKKAIISEFGSAPGQGKQRATWIREAYAALERYPQVKAVIWFNYDKRREQEPNWRIDAAAGSLKAFNETFARKPMKTTPQRIADGRHP